MNSTLKSWFLERNHDLIECEVVKDSVHAREIQFKEQNKTFRVHPEGVAWGKLFPRVFWSEHKPQVVVIHNRAAMRRTLHTAQEHKAVPSEKSNYRFQPFIADVMDSIYQGQNVILTGGTGVGKTTHITQLANRLNQPMLRINFNGETRMSDLVGKVHVVNGETKWIDGVLPMAMRHGWWLLLDELDFAEPAVLSLLHPVLEEESMLVLKENNGEIITPHLNFRVFATANTIGAMSEHAENFHGAGEMNEAFLDRWQVILVENLSVEEELKVLRKIAPGLKLGWSRKIAEFAQKARDGEFPEYTNNNFSTRKSIAWAKKAELHRDPIRGAKLSWLDKMPASEQEPLYQALLTIFGTGKKTGMKGLKKSRRRKRSSY